MGVRIAAYFRIARYGRVQLLTLVTKGKVQKAARIAVTGH